MGKETKIQWCDSTVNCTSGCDGCELWIRGKGGSCYAGAIHTRFSPSKAYPGPFEQIDLHPGRMAQAANWSDLRGKARPDRPWLGLMPRIIFISDMADALSKDVPFQYLEDEVMLNVDSEPGRRHIWMWLTKQPKRMVEFARQRERWWPSNLWVGTSVTTQATTTRAWDLLKVPASKFFLSVEPMVEPIDLDARELLCRDYPARITAGKYLDLVIVGGESGPLARPCDLVWVRSIIDQCRDSQTSCFVKQLGAQVVNSTHGGQVHLDDSHGGDWDEWVADLRVREVPCTS